MNVFFVCTGNACRSPLAACILKKKLEDRGIEASVASAGTLDWGRNPRDEFYVKLSKEKGYTFAPITVDTPPVQHGINN